MSLQFSALALTLFLKLSPKPVTYDGERHETWTFVSASEQLMTQVYVPGALFADVDKIDGHVWQQEEYQQADK